MGCKVGTEPEEFEENENKRTMVILALAIGLTIIIGVSLDLFVQGAPLGFTIPILNENATICFCLRS